MKLCRVVRRRYGAITTISEGYLLISKHLLKMKDFTLSQKENENNGLCSGVF